jgi:hypothetical protein
MKVILLSDKDWQLAKTKLEHYLHCTTVNADLLKAQKRSHPGGQALAEKWIRKNHIEAIHLARVILSQ